MITVMHLNRAKNTDKLQLDTSENVVHLCKILHFIQTEGSRFENNTNLL